MKISSVSELTDHIKMRLESDSGLLDVSVRGEISNLTKHSSGHIYFTLKDAESQIPCAMFRRDAASLTFNPEHGMSVLVTGSVSVYRPYGRYQLIVSAMEKDGAGELHRRYLALKERLGEEGLFDMALKRALPRYPGVIGIATSLTGAAVRDLVRNISRRYPPAHLVICPTLVQGEGSVDSIVSSIGRLEAHGVDVIIVGRGGGSLEDLWSFNEEKVVRAIVDCRVPVVSAVGHESDVTLSDLAADVRAETPSSAAERVVPDGASLARRLEELRERLRSLMSREIEHGASLVRSFATRPVMTRPERIIQDRAQYLDGIALERGLRLALDGYGARLEKLSAQLTALDPKGVLRRGYAIIEKQETAVGSMKGIEQGDTIGIRMRDGHATGEIKEVDHDIRGESGETGEYR